VAANTYDEFIQQVRQLGAARAIEQLLDWDQETYMPRRGAESRAAQLELIAGLHHERLTSETIGNLLERLVQRGDADDPAVATNVREIRRLRDRAVRIPRRLVEEIARTTALAKEAWAQARQVNSFIQFAPHLEHQVELKRQVADCVGWKNDRYDALLDEFEPGTRAEQVQQLFDELKPRLVELVHAIHQAPRQPDESLLRRDCPLEAQRAFNRSVAELFGFDFHAGRMDISNHPFCMSTCPDDVRFTTRYRADYLPGSLFGVMHEVGHALYEQGLDRQHAGTPMAQAVSLGLHESQSRLWENLVGRSRPFWEYAFPLLQQAFPVYSDVRLDDWHFAVNAVRPSLIRVEADEVTYGLHIMVRFDVERKMIAGQLAVRDVPDFWNTCFRQYLGLTPPTDADGCLQDIHWSLGVYGYFPTYQLGNLYAVQLFAAARRALPDLDDRLRRGELQPLREWLRANIHAHGMRYRAHELVERVTGKPLSHVPYLEYLGEKFGPLYGL